MAGGTRFTCSTVFMRHTRYVSRQDSLPQCSCSDRPIIAHCYMTELRGVIKSRGRGKGRGGEYFESLLRLIATASTD
jgi:hypothetical protein